MNILTVDGIGYAIVVWKSGFGTEVLLGSQASEYKLPIYLEDLIRFSDIVASKIARHIRINRVNVSIMPRGNNVLIQWGDSSSNYCEFDTIELLTQIAPDKVRIYKENLERLSKD